MGNGGSGSRARGLSAQRAKMRTTIDANGGGFELARQGTPGTAAAGGAKLDAARAKVTEAEALVRAAQGDILASMRMRDDLAKAQRSLARLEGRQLHPAEAGITRQEFLSGNASVLDRAGSAHTISSTEARAYLANPKPSTSRAQRASATPGPQDASRSAAAKQGAQTRANNRAGLLSLPINKFTPVAHVPGREFDIGAPPDAHVLRAAYGDQQMRDVLSLYTLPKLRDTAQAVGAKPGRSKAETVQRIYDAVTKEPYAATLARVGGERVTA